jgi:hypothetical protein
MAERCPVSWGLPPHAFRDCPERGFSQAEIVNLVRHGRVTEENSRSHRNENAITWPFIHNGLASILRNCIFTVCAALSYSLRRVSC